MNQGQRWTVFYYYYYYCLSVQMRYRSTQLARWTELSVHHIRMPSTEYTPAAHCSTRMLRFIQRPSIITTVTRGYANSRTGQLAVSQMPPKRKTERAKSPMASASCPVTITTTQRYWKYTWSSLALNSRPVEAADTHVKVVNCMGNYFTHGKLSMYKP